MRIKKFFSFFLLASSIFSLQSYAADITKVEFSKNKTAPEYLIAYDFYKSFLSRHLMDTLSTSSFDLNNDGIGEIATKIEGNNVCNENGCITSVFMHFPTGWKEILHTHSNTLDLVGKPSSGKMLNIVVNKKYLWHFNGKNYVPLLQNYGVVNNNKMNEVPIDVAVVASNALGLDIASGQWIGKVVDTGIKGGSSWLVTVNSPIVTDSQGTRYALIVPNKSVWNNVLTFKGSDKLVSYKNDKGNFINNLAIEDNNGVVFYEWSEKNHEYEKQSSSY